ncbi:uncharacterized protein, partial [Mytilus edulis]|uniref:uncharacterized protein n=1 Tax=Mytilus edulis TaxID=6550 RepID=UPI0039F027ED
KFFQVTSILFHFRCSNDVLSLNYLHFNEKKNPHLNKKKYKQITRHLFEIHSCVYIIVHISGQERYRSLTASYYRGAHGCLIMFDLTKHHTFENVTSWLTDLRQYTTNPEKISTILVGTRCHAKRREVGKEKAEAFAEHVGLPYIEVSSEEDINVREVFDLLSDNILQTLKRHPSLLMVPTMSTKLSDSDSKKKMYWCSC